MMHWFRALCRFDSLQAESLKSEVELSLSILHLLSTSISGK